MWRDTTSTVPTLAELREHSAWVWVYCERCLHHSPVAFVPLMIRWGADASSDKLRRSARCTVCGHSPNSAMNTTSRGASSLRSSQ
jgi:hypothetical protein